MRYSYFQIHPLFYNKSLLYIFCPPYLDKEPEAKSACKTQHLSNHVAISVVKWTLIYHN